MGVARFWWAAGACLAAALGLSLGPASAQLSQNWKWCVNKDKAYSPDLAIGGCTAVIQSGRESRKNLAAAFTNRGIAYNEKGDQGRAIADYNEAIRLNPKHIHAIVGRGFVYVAKGDQGRAIADYDEAIRLDQKLAYAYLNRGVAYLYGGALAKAQADFQQAAELAPNDAYPALWLDLAERRNNIPSHLAQAGTQLDMKAWPAPVIRLFLGELTPEAVLAAADDLDPKKKQEQVCVANFFSAESWRYSMARKWRRRASSRSRRTAAREISRNGLQPMRNSSRSA